MTGRRKQKKSRWRDSGRHSWSAESQESEENPDQQLAVSQESELDPWRRAQKFAERPEFDIYPRRGAHQFVDRHELEVNPRRRAQQFAKRQETEVDPRRGAQQSGWFASQLGGGRDRRAYSFNAYNDGEHYVYPRFF